MSLEVEAVLITEQYNLLLTHSMRFEIIFLLRNGLLMIS